MKILHLIAPAPAGGAESAVHSLAVGSRSLGHDVAIAALLQGDGVHPFVERLRRDGIRCIELRHPHRAYFAQARAVTAVLRETKPEVLHTHVYHADAIGFVATRRAPVPWVSTLHGFTGGGLKNRAYATFGLRLLRHCDAVICVAGNVRDRALRAGIRTERTSVIANGYHVTEALNREKARGALGLGLHEPVVGWVGRLSEEKGADLFLDAIARTVTAGMTVVIVGDGPERPALERRLQEGDLAGARIRLAGRVDDAARLLAAFDLLVLSSRTEGVPMVLLEAMAAGVPIAAFSVGGIPGVVSASSSFPVPPRDVEALAAAIDAALGDRREAERRAAVARDAFNARYSAQRFAATVSAVYRAAGQRRS